MMQLLGVIPPKPWSQMAPGNKPAYTIHDVTQRAFTVHLPVSKEYITKTTMVSFEKHDDAMRMARLLECHKAVTKDWPSTIFDDAFSLDLYVWENKNIFVDELYVHKWNFDVLNGYCMDNIVDLIYIKNLTEKNGKISFMSDRIRLDMDHSFYVNRFAVMLSRE